MAVGADQRVGIDDSIPATDAAREKFEIDLMHDAGARGHHTKFPESLHSPLDELVTLAVSRKLELHIEIECIAAAVMIDRDRVVDHQIDRYQRFDPLRIAAHFGSHVAHRGEVGEQGHAGKVL